MIAGALRAVLCWGLLAVLAAIPGCMSGEIKANQEQLAQQQAELNQLKQEVQALQARASSYQPSPPPGSCDESVSREASRKGGERFAAGDFGRALAYYQDAVSACPKDSRSQLNLARTYESLGNATAAIEHYRLAEAGADDAAAKEAREAISRLNR